MKLIFSPTLTFSTMALSANWEVYHHALALLSPGFLCSHDPDTLPATIAGPATWLTASRHGMFWFGRHGGSDWPIAAGVGAAWPSSDCPANDP